ncbi:uncharacterized protein C8Q71DRAFT_469020 [Rhodofomes roseus]|uniref:Uncharacterized protein n=1 Tax=Rhodofomes roseus TaxID=34475 RepID=A0ABQ8KP07_9APHY|nr:uncharacterized protein C8Q71DRAFT_469020 [Rhodofomes roseus]KAH9839933.1 hypothetical protein C8Q71DRAFT_469020 [Rhodofomes roseus]
MGGRRLSMSAAPEPQRDLTTAFDTVSRRTLRYEQDIQDFESRLAINLSNSRAIGTLLQEAQSALKVCGVLLPVHARFGTRSFSAERHQLPPDASGPGRAPVRALHRVKGAIRREPPQPPIRRT